MLTSNRELERLEPLMTRRSVGVFGDGAPTEAEIDAIVRAATTVPDHGALRPWRLVVIQGAGREAFGDALADAGCEADPQLRAEVGDRLRGKAFVAPALIAVVARIDPGAKVPEWEQVASAACAGYAIALAAHQLGLGAMWKSSPFQRGGSLRRVLDMTEHDQFLGWVNLGQVPAAREVGPRPEIDLSPIVRVLGADGRPVPYTTPA
jgi:nitroreductase